MCRCWSAYCETVSQSVRQPYYLHTHTHALAQNVNSVHVCVSALNSLWRRHRRTATNDNNRERHKMNERTNVPNCQHQQHSRCAALSLLSAPWQPCLLTVKQPQFQPPSPPLPTRTFARCSRFNLPALPFPTLVQRTKRFPFIRLAQAASIASSSSSSRSGGGGGGGTQKYLLYSYVFMFLMLLFLFLFALSMLLTLSAPLLLMLYTASRAPVRERVFWSLSLSLLALALALCVAPAARSLCTLLCIFVSAQKK